ncbi:hypothetical protein [Cryobacterium sp. BB736]|uniref:hypothetical protein n=1 Tax=Cryobacterium sp. BB736 TaxID=2746963 RepID=UPI0018773584|nr:hypothetical protein [Cryobacterium sp. BB736]
MTDVYDREPQPYDGPDYQAEIAAWLERNPAPAFVFNVRNTETGEVVSNYGSHKWCNDVSQIMNRRHETDRYRVERYAVRLKTEDLFSVGFVDADLIQIALGLDQHAQQEILAHGGDFAEALARALRERAAGSRE